MRNLALLPLKTRPKQIHMVKSGKNHSRAKNVSQALISLRCLKYPKYPKYIVERTSISQVDSLVSLHLDPDKHPYHPPHHSEP